MLQRADQSSAEAKETRRFIRMVHRATPASTFMIVTSMALKDRKYCTAHHASVVLFREMLIAGDQSLAEAEETLSSRAYVSIIATSAATLEVPFTAYVSAKWWGGKVLTFAGPGDSRRCKTDRASDQLLGRTPNSPPKLRKHDASSEWSGLDTPAITVGEATGEVGLVRRSALVWVRLGECTRGACSGVSRS
jgi:hypothetical protein